MKTLKLAAVILGVVAAVILGLVGYFAATFDSTRLKTELTKAVQEKKQRTLKIDGDLALSFWPNVGVRVGKVSLSEFRSEKEFAAIDSARVSVAVMPLLSKQIVVNTVELDGARATLIKHKDGKLNIDDLLSKDKSDKASSPVQADIAGIRIGNVQLTWQDEQNGQTSTLSGLDLATGRVTADTGKQAYEVNALTLAAKGKAGADSVELRLDMPRLVLAPDEAKTLTIDKIDGAIDIASPRMPMKSLKLPISGQLRAELAKQSAHGNLATRFDDSKIALKFDVAKFSPLSLGFDLDIDQLNVDKYLPPAKPGEEKKAAGDGRIDLSALKGLDVHGAVRIGKFQVSNVKASNVKLKIDAAGGRLDIAPHSMNLYDGTLSGALSVNASGNVVALR
ncbi:MAG TPA: AsmA family protein, partial [Rhodocyclaceae bacterium]|nr:AsmA family protein [Rhodocyclaceae bacterium]